MTNRRVVELRKTQKIRAEYTKKGKAALEEESKTLGRIYHDSPVPSILSGILLHTNKNEISESALREAFIKLHPLIGRAGFIDQIPILHNGQKAVAVLLRRNPPKGKFKGITYGTSAGLNSFFGTRNENRHNEIDKRLSKVNLEFTNKVSRLKIAGVSKVEQLMPFSWFTFRPLLGATAIVLNPGKDKMLLGVRSSKVISNNGMFTTPGGYQNADCIETHSEAAQRESAEEVKFYGTLKQVSDRHFLGFDSIDSNASLAVGSLHVMSDERVGEGDDAWESSWGGKKSTMAWYSVDAVRRAVNGDSRALDLEANAKGIKVKNSQIAPDVLEILKHAFKHPLLKK